MADNRIIAALDVHSLDDMTQLVERLGDSVSFYKVGMPYQKVAMMVAIVCAVVFTLILGNNAIKEAPIAVIDLDNSRYSHERTNAGWEAIHP